VSPPEKEGDKAAAMATQAGPLEVFNLGGSIEEFAEGVRQSLQRLSPGESIEYPPSLTNAQTEVVRTVAEELGYLSDSFGDPRGGTFHISVGHLAGFKRRVQADLESLGSGEQARYGPGHVEDTGAGDGAMLSFHGPGLPQLALKIVHQAVGERGGGLRATDGKQKGGAPTITVKKQSEDDDSDDDFDREDSDMDENELKEKVGKVFDMYASHNGRNVILRKPDLHKFITDINKMRESPKVSYVRKVEITLEKAESIFDDTLELQVDMGSRYTHGLTLDFFQVYLQKAAPVFGWTMTSLLVSLIDLYDASV
jgi:hypothetical protein